MVVPVKNLYNMEKIQECVGNNLKLKFSHNKKTLVVVGNNCRVQLSENSGLVRIVGNTCELSVTKGSGSIEYVGNKGKIILGSSVPEENVSYVGKNGIITNMDNSSKIQPDQDCNSRSNNFQVPNGFGVANTYHISNCNNIRINSEMGPKTYTEIIPLTISYLKVKKSRNTS